MNRRSRWKALAWRFVILLLVCCATLGTIIYVERNAVRHVLAHWTGEDDPIEQIKGVGALVLLRFSGLPPRTDPYVPIAHTGVSPYGINTFLEQEADPEVVAQCIESIATAGFKWIRQEFPWEDIEIAEKGDFWDHRWNRSAWEKYDLIIDLCEAHDIQVIARLDNPPAWTRAVGDTPGWEMAPPDDLDDYGDFVATVVGRYRGRIRYYQIWNEPNIYPEWGDQAADPAGYVELLKVGYRRAKEADPDCVIIAAGLAQTTEETPDAFKPRNMSDLLYLDRMYDAGLSGHFDIMGAQVYGLWTGPYDRRTSRDRTNFSRAQLLREIMVAHGDADKPIWATEVGWNALPSGHPAPANYGRVTEEKQAIYAVEAYQRAQREWPWMGVMNYWFYRRPSEAEVEQAWYYFRMMEPDFEPLPVYGAMSWLTQQKPMVPVGYHQEDHWALHYSDGWQHFSDEGAVLGAYALALRGEQLQFHFHGTDLSLALRDAGDVANLTVVVDGRERRTMAPWFARQVGSFAARQDHVVTTVIPVTRHLSDGEHCVSITAHDEVALDGLVVSRRPLPWAAWVLGVIVGGALLYWLWIRPAVGRR